MKKLIPLILIMSAVYAQDDIELKSAGVDASTGIVFKNSNDVVLMDIDGDGLDEIVLSSYSMNYAAYRGGVIGIFSACEN